MSVSPREQAIIQSLIDNATSEQRRELYADAEETLGNANLISGRRRFTAEESKRDGPIRRNARPD
jgi:hypothetical protein